jgi:hypothetical protein
VNGRLLRCDFDIPANLPNNRGFKSSWHPQGPYEVLHQHYLPYLCSFSRSRISAPDAAGQMRTPFSMRVAGSNELT